MKVIICGGRSLDDYSLVKNVMDEVAARIDINEIVCGEARGADSLGKWHPGGKLSRRLE